MTLLVGWVMAGALGAPPPSGAMTALPGGAGVLFGLARRGMGGEAIGFVRLDLGPEEAEVTLFVLPAARRTGVARCLLAWAGQQAGGRRLYALVDEGNLQAEAFFGALSFRRDGSGPGSWGRWLSPGPWVGGE